MLKKIFELIFNKDLRCWLKFKILHPFDRQIDIFDNPYSWDIAMVEKVGVPEWISMTSMELQANRVDAPIRLASCFISRKEFIRGLCNDGEGLSGEDVESLYRFNGVLLLALESKLDRSFFEELIDLWMNGYSKSSLAMSPYVISERLANLGVLIIRTGLYQSWSEDRKNKFHASVVTDLKFLSSQLEYLGERLTGNHLSNNARGLFWGAYLNGNPVGMEYASTMLVNEAGRILEDRGLLREGSTNYQSLVTRNYLEIYLLGRGKNQELKLIIEQMLERIYLVKPQGREVFIGDISPDFPVDYFEGLADFFNEDGNECRAEGWVSHYRSSIFKKEKRFKEIAGSFCRVDVRGMSFLAHVNRDGFPLLAGHAHCDTGSFVAISEGKEILIDLGRCHYDQRDDLYLKSISHNCIEINSQSNEILGRGVYGPAFMASISSEPKIELIDCGFKITTKWKTMAVVHERSVAFINDKIQIRDHFRGEGFHNVSLFFHFPDEITARKLISFDSSIKIIKTKRAIDYGIEKDAYKVKIELGKIQFPFEQTTEIDCE